MKQKFSKISLVELDCEADGGDKVMERTVPAVEIINDIMLILFNLHLHMQP